MGESLVGGGGSGAGVDVEGDRCAGARWKTETDGGRVAVGTDDLGADRWAVIAWGTVDMYASTVRADEGALTSGQE